MAFRTRVCCIGCPPPLSQSLARPRTLAPWNSGGQPCLQRKIKASVFVGSETFLLRPNSVLGPWHLWDDHMTSACPRHSVRLPLVTEIHGSHPFQIELGLHRRAGWPPLSAETPHPSSLCFIKCTVYSSVLSGNSTGVWTRDLGMLGKHSTPGLCPHLKLFNSISLVTVTQNEVKYPG